MSNWIFGGSHGHFVFDRLLSSNKLKFDTLRLLLFEFKEFLALTLSLLMPLLQHYLFVSFLFNETGLLLLVFDSLLFLFIMSLNALNVLTLLFKEFLLAFLFHFFVFSIF